MKPRKIAKDLQLDNKIERFPVKLAFVALEDHKENFINKAKCRLINSAKSKIGKISKKLQVRVLRILFFEFKFEFDKNYRVRVRSPKHYRSQWHEQVNDRQLFFW